MPPETQVASEAAPATATPTEAPAITSTETQAPPAPAIKDPLRPSLEDIAAQMMAANAKSKPAAETPVQNESTTEPEIQAADPTKNPAPPTPVKKPDPQSARFAALSRREQEARRREAEVQQRIRDIEARQKAVDEREQKIKAARTPLQILQAHGYKYEDATMEAVGAFTAKPADPIDTKLESAIAPVSAEMAELKAQLSQAVQALRQYEADKQQVLEHQVMKDFQSAATEGGYEFTLAFGQEALNLAKQVAFEHKQKFGRVLTYQEALDIVEGYYEKRATALLGTKKLQSRLTPATQTPPAPTKPIPDSKSAKSPGPATKPAAPKTLTQSHSQGTRATVDLDKMSPRDALAWIEANVLKSASK
jgi:hypothetical protein